MSLTETQLSDRIARLRRWIDESDYRAYDPGDGNLSYLHVFTFNNLMLERILQQAVYRSPFNLRPLLGIKRATSTKARGYFAWAYTKLYKLTGDQSCADRARECFEWLIENTSPFYSHYAWGNHFPFSTRGGKTPAFEPIVPWTALIGQAFLEAHQTFGDPRYLTVLQSIAAWIISLPRERTDTGTCISYVAFKQNSIHNSNMLAGAFLAQIGRMTDNREALAVAREAMLYSCTRQRGDGAWMYGAADKYQWNDNFHTGYNLDSLKRYIDATGNHEFDPQLVGGFAHYKNHFFEPDGRPKYYDNATYPTDIQCIAQAIDTLTFFAEHDADALPLAAKVAEWAITHMQDSDGHFYYRDLGWVMAKTPMLHWGQGTMFKALAHLWTVLHRKNSGPRGPACAPVGMSLWPAAASMWSQSSRHA